MYSKEKRGLRHLNTWIFKQIVSIEFWLQYSEVVRDPMHQLPGAMRNRSISCAEGVLCV